MNSIIASLNLISRPDWAVVEVSRVGGQKRPFRRTQGPRVLGRQGGLSDRFPTRVGVVKGLLGKK